MKMINYKKRDFYTRLNDNTFGECAVKVSGYWFYQTDVKLDDIRWLIPLYTYKHGSVWYVVEGGTGLSVGPTFTTRKAAIEYATQDEILDKLRNAVNECVNDCNFTMIDEFPEEKTFDSFDSMKRAEEDIQRQCREEAEEAENKREEETMKQEPKKDYTRFFAGCETLEEAKKLYFRETMQVHPDKGGDTETMQALNAAWEVACKRLNHTHKSMKGETYTTDEDRPFEAPEWFSEFVRAFMGMKGVEIELVGTWLYVKGNSKPYKDTLKAMGFRWSGKKKAWYKIPADYKRPAFKKSGWSMEKCEDTFGVEATYKPQGTQGLPEDDKDK